MAGAAQHLIDPAEPRDDMAHGFANPLDFFNYLSPSAWVNGVIEQVSGVDIFGYATDTLTGEWDALYKFGDALDSLAQFLQQAGIDVQAGINRLDSNWDGNAADAAVTYFTSLAAATSRQQLALHHAAEGYRDAARGAWQLSNQLGNVLQAVTDKAILIGVSAAIGTVTAETGVGAVVGYGVAGWQTIELLNLINRASMIINTAGTVIMAAFGGGMAVAGQGGDLSAVPLPAAPYAPPGA
ncbi:hypothetical protein HH310_28960 [Actinoplanes sp. TBRC 11911]|uniref:hypothetical protein n=1 Tax=Actinoplanes sp. TBRC 11911 TaxID=2729386 RepID=UPI00145CBA6F|nr:hypothetical protein [Actinoplanes sp. TBRC 11911]NMO55202.1 hypothetical protein [Actinoplanes sp. TBRC 11911]